MTSASSKTTGSLRPSARGGLAGDVLAAHVGDGVLEGTRAGVAAQQVGGIDLSPVSAELTYGLERLTMYLQGKDSVYDIQWNEHVTYGQIYHQNEVEQSRYNFDESDAAMHREHFDQFEAECLRLTGQGLLWPAYDYCLKCSHTFNLLDARGAISITERTGYIGRVRTLASSVAHLYAEQRKEMGYPMLGGNR